MHFQLTEAIPTTFNTSLTVDGCSWSFCHLFPIFRFLCGFFSDFLTFFSSSSKLSRQFCSLFSFFLFFSFSLALFPTILPIFAEKAKKNWISFFLTFFQNLTCYTVYIQNKIHCLDKKRKSKMSTKTMI